MAKLVSTLYNGKVLEGDCNIYVGPARQALPANINTTADGTLNFSGYTLLDFKESSVKTKYSQELEDEYVRESAGPIWAFMESEGCEIEFNLKRAELDVMKYGLAAAAVSNVAAGPTQVGQKILGLGDGDVQAYSFLIHMLNEEDYYRLYRYGMVIPSGELEQEFDRAKSIKTPIVFKALSDLTLPKGQRLMQCYDMRAALTPP